MGIRGEPIRNLNKYIHSTQRLVSRQRGRSLLRLFVLVLSTLSEFVSFNVVRRYIYILHMPTLTRMRALTCASAGGGTGGETGEGLCHLYNITIVHDAFVHRVAVWFKHFRARCNNEPKCEINISIIVYITPH